MRYLGWMAGVAVALGIAIAIPMNGVQGFAFGLFIGFGLGSLGYILGRSAELR